VSENLYMLVRCMLMVVPAGTLADLLRL